MSTPIIIILGLAAVALIMAVILSSGDGTRVTIIKHDRDKVDDKDA